LRKQLTIFLRSPENPPWHRGLRCAGPRLLTRSPSGNKSSLAPGLRFAGPGYWRVPLQGTTRNIKLRAPLRKTNPPSHRGLRFAGARLLRRSPSGNNPKLANLPPVQSSGRLATATIERRLNGLAQYAHCGNGLHGRNTRIWAAWLPVKDCEASCTNQHSGSSVNLIDSKLIAQW